MTMVLINVLIILTLLCIGCSSLSPTIVEEQIIWTSLREGEVYYRTPMLTNLPNRDILAFAGARKYSLSDQAPKVLTMRRSRDKGSTWEPTVFLVEDTKYYFNPGTITVDYEVNSLILLYIHCSLICVDSLPQLFMLRSYDWGYSWGKPVNISTHNPEFYNLSTHPGPGYGIQKRLSPHKGRLVVCGHIELPYRAMQCVYSDDHGDTWKIGATIFEIPHTLTHKKGDFGMDESTVVELPDGFLMLNSRNNHHYHCNCRAVAISTNGGETFPLESIYYDTTLVDSGCQGTLLLHNDVMFFANPANHSDRINMTLRWSEDYGKTWAGAIVVNPEKSAYSCLSSVDDNHIGLLYEKGGYEEMSFVKIKIH
ncbi:sialidase-1-like [Glandiceps talaboti]